MANENKGLEMDTATSKMKEKLRELSVLDLIYLYFSKSLDVALYGKLLVKMKKMGI